MRILLLSDIHANLEALDACLAIAPSFDFAVNLGDIVGYNASPHECVERIRYLDCPTVKGNHDEQASMTDDLSGFNPLAEEAIVGVLKISGAP